MYSPSTHLCFISHSCWCLEPITCWHKTPIRLIKFKDSTRHCTGPGRQLPSFTTVAVLCSQIAYLELLNYVCLLKLRSISPSQTFNFSELKTERIPLLRLSATRCSGRHGGEKGRGGGEGNLSPVEMSCFCDQWPSKVRLQRCSFSSDGRQDNEEPASLVTRDAWVWRRDRHWGPRLPHFWLQPSPNTAHFDFPPVLQKKQHKKTFCLGEK